MAAEYSSNVLQNVAANGSVIFTESPVPCNRGLVFHRDESGLFRLASANCNWFGIGADPGSATSAHNAWCGDVAIARVYSKPLNQEEVTTLWNEVLDAIAISTGVEELPAESVVAFPGGIFTLNGQRVEKTRQGIYIVNGKKILIK